MQPKAIFLDWDQTLNHFRFWGHWQQERPADYALIQQRLFQDGKTLVHEWMRGKHTAEEIVDGLAITFAPTPDGCSPGGATPWSAKELLSELKRSCELEAFTDPATERLITVARKQGIIIVIATDNMDTFTRWTVPSLNLTDRVDAILNSYELRLLKTDVLTDSSLPFFTDFLNSRDLRPQDCVIIDDGKTLQPLAQRAGFRYRNVNSERAAASHLLSLLHRV